MVGELPPEVTRADHYRLPDGTFEIVFAVEGGRVLTFREYQSHGEFLRTVRDANYLGTHAGVNALPDIDSFRNDE